MSEFDKSKLSNKPTLDRCSWSARQSRETASALTHFVAAILSVIGLGILVYKSCYPVVKTWHLVTCSIFGVGMIFLYTASTLYHWLELSERGVRRLQKFDHIMIFVFIAATYTPICLIALRGSWGWSLFGCIWGFAVLGTLLEFFWSNLPRWFATLFYVLMGWLVIVGFFPLSDALQTGALAWLLVGGFFYTSGAVIYMVKWPDPWPGSFGSHEVFHIFIVLGSSSHFWVMYKYLMAFK